jgi:hypothetical protein
MTSSTLSSSARSRHHQRRGARTGESDGRDGNLTVALGDGAGGRGGDLVAGPSLAQEQPMPSTAERITDTEALIARLEGELVASRAVEERSRSERAEHALSAAEGSAAAQKALSEASQAAAMAVLESENLELAIGSARERLAGLQGQAQQERLATARARALELARERQALGHQLQQALTHLNTVFVAWHDAGLMLAGLRYENPTLYLPHGTEQDRPFLSAIPDDLRQTFRKISSWVHPTDRRPIAEADPAPPSCARPASWHPCRPSRPASPNRC